MSDRKDPRSRRSAAVVKITTGGGHKIVTPEMLEQARKERQPSAEDPTDIHVPVSPLRRKRTSEQQAVNLQQAWKDLEDEKRRVDAERDRLMKQWPEDVTHPMVIPCVSAIDWDEQPAVPAEKIDWSRQGEPLRVKPTMSAIVTVIGLIVSILGAGAYFYWGVRTHIDNKQVHVPNDGVTWGVRASYETRKEAQRAREQLGENIKSAVKQSTDQVKQEVIQEIRRDRRRGRRPAMRRQR